MSHRAPRTGDVFAAYRPRMRNELRTEWAVALLYRPVSLVVTPLFAALGVPPNAVTLLALACAISLPALALAGGSAAAFQVGLVAAIFCVLDCIDGDLARVTGKASARGAYADFLTDLLYRVALYAALGILVDASARGDPGWLAPLGPRGGLLLALGCGLLALVARACRLYMGEGGSPASSGVGGILLAAASGLDHLLPIAVLLLAFTGGLEWLLAYLVVYSLGDFAATQRSVLARLG